MNGHFIICDDIDALHAALFGLWQTLANRAVRERGRFHVALSGGSTPKAFFAYLAEFGQDLPWGATWVYFGDERCVPRDHADSNFRMASTALLNHVPVPAGQVHAMFDPTQSPGDNASRYAQLLAEQLPQDTRGRPVFDLILLGMGNDGHTASLFPDTPLLKETTVSVGAQYVDKLQAWRITLTYPVINAARHVALMVAGAGKAEILRAVADTPPDELRFPVQGVNPRGQLDWYLDKAAAARLRPPTE